MKILIITQKYDLNDSNLGAFNIWWEKLAEKADFVYILALEKKSESPIKNMEILSMGKERGLGKFGRLVNFYKNIAKILSRTDLVFIHMIPLYLFLAWLPAKILRNKIVLWYAGVTMNGSVRLAAILSDAALTSHESGLRMKSGKVKVVGHGIDIEKFEIFSRIRADGQKAGIRILSVGRITPSKGHLLAIESAAKLVKSGYLLKLDIIGGVVQEKHQEYSEILKEKISELGLGNQVGFLGPIRYEEMPKQFSEADVLINAVPSGGFDKTIIEAMASGVVPITSNEFIKSAFPEELRDKLFFKEDNQSDLVSKLKAVIDQRMWANQAITSKLREIAEEKYGLEKFIEKIYGIFESLIFKNGQDI